jgi:hypothetical protein
MKISLTSPFAVRISTILLAGLAFLFCSVQLASADPPPTTPATPPATNSVAPKAVSPAPDKVAEPHQLTGAELYSMHCNRCHPERYPTERTGAQWKTIMLHMQVRANLPVSQSKLILKYLQDNSGR